MNDPQEYKIIISPIGDVDVGILKPISREITRVFGYPSQTVSLLQNVDFAFNPDRNQYHSTPILEKLAGMAPRQTIKIIGITSVDLYIPILTHVYGEAQLGGKACIVSTYRLDEGISVPTDQDGYRFRLIKETIHEIGHTFDLRHCPDQTCIMHYGRTVEDVDKKSDQFCRYCSIFFEDEVKKIQESYE